MLVLAASSSCLCVSPACPPGGVENPSWLCPPLPTPLGHRLWPVSGLLDGVRPCPSPDDEGHNPDHHMWALGFESVIPDGPAGP